jgi:hypothetical protein
MLKFYFLFLTLVFSFYSCVDDSKTKEDESLNVILRSPINLDGSIDSTALPIIALESPVWEFDTILQGEIVSYDYLFKNVGQGELLISDVHTSCGCTITEYEKKAIKPGMESKLSIKFDSKDKYGKQDKSITIYSNTYPNKTILNFTGFVKTKD